MHKKFINTLQLRYLLETVLFYQTIKTLGQTPTYNKEFLEKDEACQNRSSCTSSAGKKQINYSQAMMELTYIRHPFSSE